MPVHAAVLVRHHPLAPAECSRPGVDLDVGRWRFPRDQGVESLRALETVAADVVGHVHRVGGTWVRAPAAREAAVLAPGAGEGRIQWPVRHRDRYVVAIDLPA